MISKTIIYMLKDFTNVTEWELPDWYILATGFFPTFKCRGYRDMAATWETWFLETVEYHLESDASKQSKAAITFTILRVPAILQY